jgi:ABC-type branched-subunit amino acid transport system substrate-binding protein
VAPLFANAQVLIGQTSGFTGAQAAGVKEGTEGAKLYFEAVNASGGIGGQRIEVVSLDDNRDPKKAAENARKLIVDSKVIAIFLSRGTPVSEAVIKVINEFKVPLVAPSTGAMSLHQPVNPLVFNVRATYQREAEKVVRHLLSIGVKRIAVLHNDDSFGRDALAGALRGFEGGEVKPVIVEKFDRSKPNLEALMPRVAATTPQAVLFFSASEIVANGTKLLQQSGARAQIVTLSNNASRGFIELMGPHAYGTIVTQVFPAERNTAIAVVKEVTDLANRKGLKDVTPSMLEGFVAAKVLVEGLRRATPKPTRETLVRGLESLRRHDLGGLEITYGPDDRTGLDFADLSIVDRTGKFRR